MRKTFTQKISAVLALVSAFTVIGTSCGGLGGHEHSFTKKIQEETYLKTEATCKEQAVYYYACECGEKGEKTFSAGQKKQHNFTAEVVDKKYLKNPGDCLTDAEYFKSCVTCGDRSSSTFMVAGAGEHNFKYEVAEGQYLKAEATKTSPAVYYTSCVCGLASTDATFTYGEPLRTYTEEEKIPYTPTSLTVSLYDAENSVYGFTYNTQSKPLRPVVQVSEGSTFDEATCVEVVATVELESSYIESNNRLMTYYIVKAEVVLESSKTYTYRAYDKYVEVGTDEVTMTARDTSSTSFRFAHVADSQDGVAEFTKVLENVTDTHDFLVHTGDFVENSKYEDQWTAMIHGNFDYLSKIPVMAISGNHETTYLNGSNETYKHFHHKMPEQETELGYYYSFTYGNAKFIMLNTNISGGSGISNEQYDWLVSELQNNTATWTIVTMHYPMYSAGRYGSLPSLKSTSEALRKKLHPVFAEYGVDLVLQGHDHVVSRTNAIDINGAPKMEDWQLVDGLACSVDPQGVIYTMTGTSGTQTRGPVTEADATLYRYKLNSNKSSWTEYEINGNKMTVTVKYAGANGVQNYEQWGIVKSA